jgi:hypothetical protein
MFKLLATRLLYNNRKTTFFFYFKNDTVEVNTFRQIVNNATALDYCINWQVEDRNATALDF